jgi:hypothetical protein
MIGSFKKTRKDIVKLIMKCPMTPDNFYVCKDFRKWNSELGDTTERNYKYSRSYFENKICFNTSDIELYLETFRVDNYDIDNMKKRDNYLYNIIKEEIEIVDDIYENLPGCAFSLAELIDTSIFMYNSKF